jgi:hypothetical protein
MDEVTLKEAFACIRFFIAEKFKSHFTIETLGLVQIPIDTAWEYASLALEGPECVNHSEGEPEGIFPGGALLKRVMWAAKADLEARDVGEIEGWLHSQTPDTD